MPIEPSHPHAVPDDGAAAPERELLALAALDAPHGAGTSNLPSWDDGADRAAAFLRRFEALAQADEQAWPGTGDVRRAATAATVAMRARLAAGPAAPASEQTVGRIGGGGRIGSGDWRRIRWPLALATVLAVGLALAMVLIESSDRGPARQATVDRNIDRSQAIQTIQPLESRPSMGMMANGNWRNPGRPRSPVDPRLVEEEVDELVDSDLFATNDPAAAGTGVPAFAERLEALASLSDYGAAELAAWDWDALDEPF